MDLRKICKICKKNRLKEKFFIRHNLGYGDGYLPRCKKCTYKRKKELKELRPHVYSTKEVLKFVDGAGIYL